VTWLRYWRGRWRLRFGFCPLCYSSPPNKTCPICAGWYEYGGNLSGRQARRLAGTVGQQSVGSMTGFTLYAEHYHELDLAVRAEVDSWLSDHGYKPEAMVTAVCLVGEGEAVIERVVADERGKPTLVKFVEHHAKGVVVTYDWINPTRLPPMEAFL